MCIPLITHQQMPPKSRPAPWPTLSSTHPTPASRPFLAGRQTWACPWMPWWRLGSFTAGCPTGCSVLTVVADSSAGAQEMTPQPTTPGTTPSAPSSEPSAVTTPPSGPGMTTFPRHPSPGLSHFPKRRPTFSWLTL